MKRLWIAPKCMRNLLFYQAVIGRSQISKGEIQILFKNMLRSFFDEDTIFYFAASVHVTNLCCSIYRTRHGGSGSIGERVSNNPASIFFL